MTRDALLASSVRPSIRRRHHLALGAFVLAVTGASLYGCEETRRPPTEQQPSEPSPNASIMPAPLASELGTKSRRASSPDAGVPEDAGPDAAAVSITRWLNEDQAPDPDLVAREGVGARLFARLHWLDLPPFPRLPESNVEALARLRDASAFDFVIELSSVGRMSIRLASDSFALPRGSELRARLDRLGHLLFWNDGNQYTTLPAGTLRAVLSERRPDHTPLVKPKLTLLANGNLLGLQTERVELSTSLGRLLLEDAAIPSAGSSGKLLCRFLGELVAADPASTACERSLVPLRAELFSRAGGHLLFEVSRIERERPLETALAPTPEAHFTPEELPPGGLGLVTSEERLRELRLRPVPRSEKAEPSAPKQGLVIQNRSDTLRYVVLDGVVVARVLPRDELPINSLLPGKYALVTLDFLGDDPTPLRIIELPARVAIGDEADPGR
jgi:hypothetical protein